MSISLEEASQYLNRGQVVAVPTETVYGLAASLAFPEAIAQIFELKKRPSSNPLIVHVEKIEQIKELALSLPPGFDALSEAFWPGPMTLILDVNQDSVPSLVRAGLPTAAFRMPNHPLALQLISLTGPLVMPSANLSGKPSATSEIHVKIDFGDDFPILDGGRCGHGLESTILTYIQNSWQIIRQGALSPEAFYPVLGYSPSIYCHGNPKKPLCPGQAFRHYAPAAKLLTGDCIDLTQTNVVLGFSDRDYPKGTNLMAFGSLNDPKGVAENFYAVLRQLDEHEIKMAWVDMDLPEGGLWQTIQERLQRAIMG